MPGDDERSAKKPDGTVSALLREMARADAREPPVVEDLVGATVAHYRVEAKLGQGGMGVVYRARDARLARDVALKVLPASVAADSERRARLLREARSAAAVNHPNIAAVYDVGESEGRVYLAMELVEGTTLRERLSGGALPALEALRIARGIATGLARAHEKSIVHRDLKPENVILARDGAVKILDFGLAKLREPDSSDSALAKQETQTLEGRVMGTPGYMSPEQASGRAVDARTDVYALGVVMHEMLTGGLPGVGSGRKPISNQRLEAVVARCLAPSPDARWSDAGRLLAALEATGSPARRTAWLVVLGIAALLGAGGVAASAWRGAPTAAPPTSSPAASAAAAPAATTYTDQPVPPTEVSVARAEFLSGLQALRDDDFMHALGHFTAAAKADPAMAAGHLRVAIVSSLLDPETARTELDAAAGMRTKLSERDQVFLDALEPVIGRVHKDYGLATARLEAASARWPGDVEILDWIAGLGNASPGRVLEASQRAVALDPGDAQAFENLGNVLAVMGRYDEARSALERGTAIATQSGDLYLWLSQLDSVQGRCADMERDARRVADIDRSQGTLILLWADLALRRPEATLRELVAQTAIAQPEPLPTVFRGLGETWVPLALGRFDQARAASDRLASAIAKAVPTAYLFQYWLALGRVHLALETGDPALAREVAADFGARHETWTQSMYPHGAGAVDLTPWLAHLADDRPHAIDAMRSAWIDEQLRDAVLPGLVWSYGWAAPARTREEAVEAIGAREHDARVQPQMSGTSLAVVPGGIPDAYTGHVYLLAGRPVDAVAPLKRAAATCAGGFALVDQVHAALDLGQALEQTGDAKGACDAYAQVLARWGHAVPRSVSAEAARAGVNRLHCAQ